MAEEDQELMEHEGENRQKQTGSVKPGHDKIELKRFRDRMAAQLNRKLIIIAVLVTFAVVLAFVVGYLVRRAVHKPKCDNPAPAGGSSGKSMAQKEIEWDSIVKMIDAAKIDANMKYLAAKPHVAASPRNNELASEIERRFKSFGFEVEKPQYKVLLSYPNKKKPNRGYILDGGNKVNFTTQYIEDILEPSERSPDSVQPFNAFGLAGNATGDLVYVNYGTVEDFRILKEHFRVNCTGKIVIARYGKIGRASKVKHAEDNGASAIMIYNDPQNYGPVPAEDTFPHSLWMPRDGVQRGSIGRGDGDILTPGWPSTDDAYRLPIAVAPGLPKIPCHPISAKDAKQFISKLGGQSVGFANWTGGLGIKYNVGPGFAAPYTSWKVKVEVHNSREILQITNVIGTLKGALEPDRYVMVGNHRDSWVFGGVDASSGGSVLLELARVVGEKAKSGWRPARSLRFCSWGGEEAGLIGSSEYVEQNIKVLRERVVTYVNIDTAVYGNYSIQLSSSQLLYKTIYNNLKKVKDANTANTMFQKAVIGSPSIVNKSMPRIGRVGSGSDYAHFYHYGAIPVVDIMHGMNDIHLKNKKATSYYPVYHSLHDTYYWVKKFIDPKFQCHRAVAEFTGRLLFQYADSDIIPFDPRDYTVALEKGVADLAKIFGQKGTAKYNVTTDYLDKAVKKFKAAANTFMTEVGKIDKSKIMQLRMANDQLTLLEKGFLFYPAFPGRPSMRHIIFSQVGSKSYGASAFPGATDLLYEVMEKKSKTWGDLNKHLTEIASTIEGVAISLRKTW